MEIIGAGATGPAMLACGMNLTRLWIVALLVTFMSFLHVAAAETDSPAAVVKALYRSSVAHSGFDSDVIKYYKPFITPDLYASIKKKADQPVAKGDAPDIEGDLILNAQDAPTKWEMGDSSINGTKAKVGVTLHWDSEKRQYTVLLKQVGGAWKVYDIEYGGTDGKLTDLLK
jgi:hypothetical protein